MHKLICHHRSLVVKYQFITNSSIHLRLFDDKIGDFLLYKKQK